MKLGMAPCETPRVLLKFPPPRPSNSKDSVLGLRPSGPVFQPALTSVCSWHLRRQKRFVVWLFYTSCRDLSLSFCYCKQSHHCLPTKYIILVCCSICPQTFALICLHLVVKSELADLLLLLLTCMLCMREEVHVHSYYKLQAS